MRQRNTDMKSDPVSVSRRFLLMRTIRMGFCLSVFLLRLSLRALPRLGRGTALKRLLGEELAVLLEKMGATYIKLGQILSSRPDLLSKDVADPLARLQNDVAPFDTRGLAEILEQRLGRPLDEAFADFQWRPIAAASIAQVHRGLLHDGRQVAVKIRRPGLLAQVYGDLELLRLGAGLLGRLPGMGAVPMPELVADLSRCIRRQLHFRREADNLRRFHANFQDAAHITMPRLIEELCRDSVLTMEYLGDAKAVDDRAFSRQERRTAALAGLRALYKMIFLDGLIHADMHPGNVFLRPWGEVVLLDFGLVAELDTEDRRRFVDFFFALVNNEGEVCANIIYEMALRRPRGFDKGGFRAAISDIVARHSSLRSQDFEITGFVFELIDTQRHFGLRGSTDFIMTVLSMVVFDGICKQLYPDCDFQREARPYLITAKYTRISGTAAARTAGAQHQKGLDRHGFQDSRLTGPGEAGRARHPASQAAFG
ncbi:MAG TPA: AarF/UbiB family protein [Acidobacteriota bacterium]|nr:AarF/UbiB family protein [Acidobacteriota bacterium]